MTLRLRSAVSGDADRVLAPWGSWRPSATPEALSPDGHRIVVVAEIERTAERTWMERIATPAARIP